MSQGGLLPQIRYVGHGPLLSNRKSHMEATSFFFLRCTQLHCHTGQTTSSIFILTYTVCTPSIWSYFVWDAHLVCTGARSIASVRRQTRSSCIVFNPSPPPPPRRPEHTLPCCCQRRTLAMTREMMTHVSPPLTRRKSPPLRLPVTVNPPVMVSLADCC